MTNYVNDKALSLCTLLSNLYWVSIWSFNDFEILFVLEAITDSATSISKKNREKPKHSRQIKYYFKYHSCSAIIENMYQISVNIAI